MKKTRFPQRAVRLGLILALLVLGACAPNRTWVSLPAVQQVQSDAFDISAEPVKLKGNAFSAFRLTVANRSGHPLKIDWNRSRYLLNGKAAGRFAFKGVSPEQIRSGTIDDDLVAPGGRLTKIIAPIELIAFAPLGRKGVGIAEEGIAAGQLPEGKNGISLVLFVAGDTIRRDMSVVIEAVSDR